MLSSVYSCQGTTIIPEIVRVTRKLLETHLRLQIYREYGIWVHDLYGAHVQPTLAAHYKNTKGSMGYADRLVAAVQSHPPRHGTVVSRATPSLQMISAMTW